MYSTYCTHSVLGEGMPSGSVEAKLRMAAGGMSTVLLLTALLSIVYLWQATTCLSETLFLLFH